MPDRVKPIPLPDMKQMPYSFQEWVRQVTNLLYSSSGVIPLSSGGTSASLTASVGALVYSTASALALLSPGATTTILVGGGAAAPVWTTATGSGAPVRATSPALTTPNIGAATGTTLNLSGQFTSTLAIGTAPFVITSTTKVANLNADSLDDQSGAYYLDSANFTGTNWTDLTDAGATTLHKHDHGGQDGLSDNDHPQYLLVVDIDDTPVNGELTQPISSNWAFDHVAAADPHTGYRLESADHSHQSTGLQGGQLDHGLALTGLSDDDHPQYLLVSNASETIDDRVAVLIQNGTGITWSYSDVGNTLTPTVTITQYTDELAQDAVGGMVANSAQVTLTYVDATPSLTADLVANSVTPAYLSGDIFAFAAAQG